MTLDAARSTFGKLWSDGWPMEFNPDFSLAVCFNTISAVSREGPMIG
jgi:hypothetical protein